EPHIGELVRNVEPYQSRAGRWRTRFARRVRKRLLREVVAGTVSRSWPSGRVWRIVGCCIGRIYRVWNHIRIPGRVIGVPTIVVRAPRIDAPPIPPRHPVGGKSLTLDDASGIASELCLRGTSPEEHSGGAHNRDGEEAQRIAHGTDSLPNWPNR